MTLAEERAQASRLQMQAKRVAALAVDTSMRAEFARVAGLKCALAAAEARKQEAMERVGILKDLSGGGKEALQDLENQRDTHAKRVRLTATQLDNVQKSGKKRREALEEEVRALAQEETRLRASLETLEAALAAETARLEEGRAEAEEELQQAKERAAKLKASVDKDREEQAELEQQLQDLQERARKGVLARETIVKLASQGRDRAAEIHVRLTTDEGKLEEEERRVAAMQEAMDAVIAANAEGTKGMAATVEEERSRADAATLQRLSKDKELQDAADQGGREEREIERQLDEHSNNLAVAEKALAQLQSSASDLESLKREINKSGERAEQLRKEVLRTAITLPRAFAQRLDACLQEAKEAVEWRRRMLAIGEVTHELQELEQAGRETEHYLQQSQEQGEQRVNQVAALLEERRREEEAEEKERMANVLQSLAQAHDACRDAMAEAEQACAGLVRECRSRDTALRNSERGVQEQATRLSAAVILRQQEVVSLVLEGAQEVQARAAANAAALHAHGEASRARQAAEWEHRQQAANAQSEAAAALAEASQTLQADVSALERGVEEEGRKTLAVNASMDGELRLLNQTVNLKLTTALAQAQRLRQDLITRTAQSRKMMSASQATLRAASPARFSNNASGAGSSAAAEKVRALQEEQARLMGAATVRHQQAHQQAQAQGSGSPLNRTRSLNRIRVPSLPQVSEAQAVAELVRGLQEGAGMRLAGRAQTPPPLREHTRAGSVTELRQVVTVGLEKKAEE